MRQYYRSGSSELTTMSGSPVAMWLINHKAIPLLLDRVEAQLHPSSVTRLWDPPFLIFPGSHGTHLCPDLLTLPPCSCCAVEEVREILLAQHSFISVHIWPFGISSSEVNSRLRQEGSTLQEKHNVMSVPFLCEQACQMPPPPALLPTFLKWASVEEKVWREASLTNGQFPNLDCTFRITRRAFYLVYWLVWGQPDIIRII